MLDFEAALARLGPVLEQEAAVVIRSLDRTRAITWRQLHDLEREILDALEDRVAEDLLRMVSASPAFGYPVDDRAADFGDSNVRPVTYSAILKACVEVH